MRDDMTPEIKRLRALLENATPGPWTYLGTPRGYEVLVPSWSKAEADLKHTENMRLLEAAVKSLPALLDVAEAAGRYIAAVNAEEGQAIALASLRTALARLDESSEEEEEEP